MYAYSYIRKNLNDATLLVPPAFRLDKQFSKEIIIPRGQTKIIEIPFVATPRPKVVWTHNGKVIEESTETRIRSGTKVESVPGLTCLTIAKAEKSMSGTYTLKIENPLGSTEIALTVKVLDVPSSVRNLQTTQMLGDSCKLKWEPPAEDGDAPPLEYIVERKEVISGRRGIPQQLTITKDTEFDATELVIGKSYVFQVTASNSVGKSEPVETATVLAKFSFGKHSFFILSQIYLSNYLP